MSDKSEKSEEKKDEKPSIPEEITKITKHSVKINDTEINYTVTTGTVILHKEEEEKEPQAKASIFYVAYTKDGVDNLADRPITFSFNGGPGSSSVWMHIGLLGPRRVIAEDNGQPVPPPYKLVNNDYSILDVTDLIFIDPVSTGYSRAVPGEKSDQFHEFKKDIESVGEFIRLYASRNIRWSSPKFLIGESYGTTRAAGLSGYLQDEFGLYLNGIMLISSILNFSTAYFAPGNDLPPLLFLPTYSAIAWYHKRLKPEYQNDLNFTLNEVKKFAENEYLPALWKGDSIQENEKNNIINKLSEFTGLSKDYIDRTNLRIEIFRFTKELLRNERKTVGRLDARFTGIDRDAAGENFSYDPSYPVIQGPYTATFNDYVRKDLDFESDLPYEILKSLYEKWKFDDNQNSYVNVAETLRDAMSKNRDLKIFQANGYYDLATPFFATEYTFNHMELDPSLKNNVEMHYFQAGHMMYLHIESLQQLAKDLKNFITSSI